MIRLYKEIFKRFSKLEGMATVIAYGSTITGNSRTDSDVDIAVISEDKKAKEIAEDIADEILFDYGKVISLVFMSPEELASRKSWFFERELLRGRILYGGKNTKGIAGISS